MFIAMNRFAREPTLIRLNFSPQLLSLPESACLSISERGGLIPSCRPRRL
jgi:hypothetical protein